MAAGMGSRYGGDKQIDGLGPHMYKIHSFDESFNVPSVKDRTRLTACILASM